MPSLSVCTHIGKHFSPTFVCILQEDTVEVKTSKLQFLQKILAAEKFYKSTPDRSDTVYAT